VSFDRELISEARRQLTVCNACRYCEGYCATFLALERRSALTEGDISLIANICHDCRGCFQACMFTPPHEFAVNIPALLSQVRVESYKHYTWPQRFAPLFGRTAVAASISGALGLLVLAAITFASGGNDRFFVADPAKGSFYRIVPWIGMVLPAMALSIWALLSFAGSAMQFARDARIRLTDLLDPRAVGTVAREAVTLRWMKGGGDGCYYPEKERTSDARRLLHAAVVLGFLLALASTTVAAIYQEILGILPPYDLLSPPVMLGSVGGIAMIIGSTGLLWLKARAARSLIAPSMLRMDTAFLVVFDLASITGMALLALRDSPLMASALLVHLATLAALYATIPYGKFAHVVYRLLALLQNRRDLVEDERATLAPLVFAPPVPVSSPRPGD
jgi:citrate/tricarballylate utilization protein